MQLAPGQLPTLDKMGIPVWELRGSANNSLLADKIELTEQQLQAKCLLIHGQENHTEQKQQLLASILSVLKIDLSEVAIISQEQLPLLSVQQISNRLLLVFGEKFLSSLSRELTIQNLMMHKFYAASSLELNLIVTHDFSELIQKPVSKRDTWQALKLAKQYYKQIA